jgi:hypothetical protein
MQHEQTIAAWEDDGGARGRTACLLVGTENQIAWAEQIRANVSLEFDRVAAALGLAAAGPTNRHPSQARLAIAILEEKRGAVMARTDAGYFIKDWQEIRDQVRFLITSDVRYKAAKDRMDSNS